MAIVKMKRIRLIAMAEDKDALMGALLHAGCVELSEPAPGPEDAGWRELLRRDTSRLAEARARQGELKQALDTLRRVAPQKEKLLAPRREIGEAALLDPAALEGSLALAGEINERAKKIGQLNAREVRLEAERSALLPWAAYPLPLEEKGTRTVEAMLGTVPAAVDFNELSGALAEAAEATDMTLLGRDREQQYLSVLCHRSCREAALEALRRFGFAFAQLKELTGTVQENLERLKAELDQVETEREAERQAIRDLGGRTAELKCGMDRLQQVAATEGAKEKLLVSRNILYLEGWMPAEDAGRLERTLSAFDCAWELRDPDPEEYDKVPVRLKNGPLTRCMNMVTEMYALPVYGTVDPNPLMAPFFILFYGIMMADMGYGILMVLGAIFMVKKMRARGGMRNFAELLFYCGISTFIMGAVTGGFFGDFLTQLMEIIRPGTNFSLPALFTPMTDTIAILGGSLVLGFIQIITGQIVSFVEKARNGHLMDGVWDEGTWWVLYLAVGFLALGIGNVGGYPVLLIAGLLMLAVGSTRNARGIAKIGSFVGAVYNGVTGIFSDVMSYARLMALMLSGSIIASVFNTLGGITGNVFFFLVISMLGNSLNFALNLLGCYVHDLRLQCLEFFGKFYQDGGKPFRPLAIQTKYVDVKEEN